MKKYLITISLIALLSLLYYTFAQAASSGPNSAGTGADDSAVGTVAWSNPERVTTSDNSYAQIASGSAFISHYLKGTNYGFSIPAGATINGIVVEIERGVAGGGATDEHVKIVKSDGTIGTTNKADTATGWTGTDTYISYGNSGDLWGETWTATDINDSDFGAVISADVDAAGAVAFVDHIRITVYYTAASGASGSQTSLQVGNGTLQVGNGVLQIGQ